MILWIPKGHEKLTITLDILLFNLAYNREAQVNKNNSVTSTCKGLQVVDFLVQKSSLDAKWKLMKFYWNIFLEVQRLWFYNGTS